MYNHAGKVKSFRMEKAARAVRIIGGGPEFPGANTNADIRGLFNSRRSWSKESLKKDLSHGEEYGQKDGYRGVPRRDGLIFQGGSEAELKKRGERVGKNRGCRRMRSLMK